MTNKHANLIVLLLFVLICAVVHNTYVLSKPSVVFRGEEGKPYLSNGVRLIEQQDAVRRIDQETGTEFIASPQLFKPHLRKWDDKFWAEYSLPTEGTR